MKRRHMLAVDLALTQETCETINLRGCYDMSGDVIPFSGTHDEVDALCWAIAMIIDKNFKNFPESAEARILDDLRGVTIQIETFEEMLDDLSLIDAESCTRESLLGMLRASFEWIKRDVSEYLQEKAGKWFREENAELHFPILLFLATAVHDATNDVAGVDAVDDLLSTLKGAKNDVFTSIDAITLLQ